VFFFSILDTQEDFMEMTKTFFWISSLSDIEMDPMESLTLYINIIRSLMHKSDDDIRRAIIDSGMTVQVLNEEQTDLWLNRASNNTIIAPEYEAITIDSNIARALSGIFLNFITKRLTSANLENWFKSRVSAYGKVCGIREDNPVILELRPSLNFTENINSVISSCFPVKTIIFKIVRNMSAIKSHSLGNICEVTMVYYHMSELTGFHMVHSEILLKNPILLGWNGLAKHTPKLYAALSLFRRLGDDGPYCKFLYRPQELRPFQFSNIGIFITLAHEILVMEGHQTFSNYKDVQSANTSQALASKMKEILSLYGGARTKIADTTRRELLVNPDELSDLMITLNSGLGVREEDDPSGPSVPN
jgi:hypothetical protein